MGELGSLLTRAREARGLTLEDAERDTRISRRYLQALEAEQFEVIPAPVYARGFLRSYSQYLGIDPQEALSLFPREDDPDYQRAAEVNAPPPRASKDHPVSPVSAARPSWRPTPQGQGYEQQQPALPQMEGSRPTLQARRPQREEQPGQRRGAATAAHDPAWEPVIGVDIGLANPAKRIKTDPAAQTRTVVVAIVAVGVILGAVLVAILISNLGGGGEPPPGTAPDSTTRAGSDLATSTATTSTAVSNVTPGIVPTLIGRNETEAKAMLAAAGYVIREIRDKNSAEKGTVFDQNPIPGTELPQGRTVQIAVSEGP